MARAGFVFRFLKPCVVAALTLLVAACGGGDGGGAPPPAPQPVSLAIEGLPTAPMQLNSSAQLTATLTYSDSSTKDVTATATWSTSNSGVLSASSAGAILAIAPGQAEVTASTQGLSARGSVTVAPPAPRLALFAGNMGGAGNADGTGSLARFNGPRGLATDSAGAVYVADAWNHTIRKVTPAGLTSTLAGKAGSTGSADGVGTEARFSYEPRGVATDSTGNVYVADTYNHTIRKITPAGLVSTLAGAAGSKGSEDGKGADARFWAPSSVATDSAGNVYVADTYNHTIRKISASGIVSTLAGTAGMNGSADGVGTEARFKEPQGVAADSAGNVYVADTGNSTVRKVTPTGLVSTLAGQAGAIGSIDGVGDEARFHGLQGIAVDRAGSVYVAEDLNHTIRRITPDRVVSTVAGTAGSSGSADGIGTNARFSYPRGVATDGDGNLFVADSLSTIRRVTASAVVSTLAGAVTVTGSADGAGAEALFWAPYGIATDGLGNVYLTDAANNTIRKATPTGVVSTLAGLAGSAGRADGVGAQARFSGPTGVAVDKVGNLYVIDSKNNIVRKMSPEGVVSTFAGTGAIGMTDGDAATATFGFCTTPNHYEPICRAAGIATDDAGNVYVADVFNGAIRKITPGGLVSTLATGLSPQDIVTDRAGNIYVATTTAVWRIDPTGNRSLLAEGFSRALGIATDGVGKVYVADWNTNIISSINSTGSVTTIVGVAGVSGFIPGALPGVIAGPKGVAVSGTSLFITLSNGVAVVTDVP